MGKQESNQSRYEESKKYYETAILLDCNFTAAWKGKSVELQNLNLTGEAAIASAKANDLEMPSDKKLIVFLMFLSIYLLFTILGFLYIIPKLRFLPCEAIALLANSLGFLAFGWTFSGLFDIKLLVTFLGLMFFAIFITIILMGSLGDRVSSFRQVIGAFWILFGVFWDYERRHAGWSFIVKIISLIIVIIYPIFSIIFYFRFNLCSEQIILQFLRINLLIIPAIGLAVTLPPIIDAMLFSNANLNTLNTLLVFQFGNLGINSLMISVVLWIFGLAYSEFSIPISFLKITFETNEANALFSLISSLFVFVFLIPYLAGWQHEKRLHELFLRKHQTWIKELSDILEFSAPSLYISKLLQLNIDIEASKSICRGTFITGITEIDEQGDELNYYNSLFEEDNRQRIPCASYLDFLDNLQENLGGIIAQLEGSTIEDENKLLDMRTAMLENIA